MLLLLLLVVVTMSISLVLVMITTIRINSVPQLGTLLQFYIRVCRRLEMRVQDLLNEWGRTPRTLLVLLIGDIWSLIAGT